jgi:hypothetical protein
VAVARSHWSCTGGENGYHVSPWLNISQYTSNGSASLTPRLYERNGVSNYQVRVRLDDLESTGCTVTNPSFETTGSWSLSRSDGPLHGGLHLYDPVYTTTSFDMIARLYAGVLGA